MTATVTLATRPFIAQWMRVKHGSPATLPKDSELRYVLRSMLDKKFCNQKGVPGGTCELKIRISGTVFKEDGFNLSDANQRAMNRFLQKHISRDLAAFVNYHRIYGETVQAAIHLYCERFGWTDEMIKHETLVKTYQRGNEEIFRSVSLNVKPNV